MTVRPDPAGWRGRQLASLCCCCKDKAFASGRSKGRDAAPSAPGPESESGRLGHSSQLQRGVCRAPPPPSSHSPPPLVLSRACWAGRAACRPGPAHARRRSRPRAAADGPLASACSEAASVAATDADPPNPFPAQTPFLFSSQPDAPLVCLDYVGLRTLPPSPGPLGRRRSSRSIMVGTAQPP